MLCFPELQASTMHTKNCEKLITQEIRDGEPTLGICNLNSLTTPANSSFFAHTLSIRVMELQTLQEVAGEFITNFNKSI